MDKRAAAVVLGLLQANWPHVQVSQATSIVWIEHLRDVPEASGLATANYLIDTAEHFPNIHEFRTAWQNRERRERQVFPALPSTPPAPRSVSAFYLAKIREDMKLIGVEGKPREPTRHVGPVPINGDIRDHCAECRAIWQEYLEQQA